MSKRVNISDIKSTIIPISIASSHWLRTDKLSPTFFDLIFDAIVIKGKDNGLRNYENHYTEQNQIYTIHANTLSKDLTKYKTYRTRSKFGLVKNPSNVVKFTGLKILISGC